RVQAGRERARKPEVDGEAQQIGRPRLAGDVGRAVGRAVVDDERLDDVDPGQRARQSGQRLGEVPFLVEARDLDDQLDHAYAAAVRGPWADGTTLAADLARYHQDPHGCAVSDGGAEGPTSTSTDMTVAEGENRRST